MDQHATQESKEQFRLKLKEFDVSVTVYQVLETIHRQHVMACRLAGYQYVYEQKEPKLRETPGDPLATVNRHLDYIEAWSRTNHMEYGLEKVFVNETAKHDEQVNAYHDALKDLEVFSKKHGEFLKDGKLSDLTKQMREGLKQQLSIAGRPPGAYLAFARENGGAQLDFTRFDYFTAYIAVAYAVFGQFFEFLMVSGRAERKKSPFYVFLSTKMRHENQDLPGIASRFTAKVIHDRIHSGAEQAEKRYKSLLEQQGIVSVSFLKYLADHSTEDADYFRRELRRRNRPAA